MVPRRIHYCWFGRGEMPEMAKKCIDSWHKYLPDYEYKLWNEDNFDVNVCPYTAEAYALYRIQNLVLARRTPLQIKIAQNMSNNKIEKQIIYHSFEVTFR